MNAILISNGTIFVVILILSVIFVKGKLNRCCVIVSSFLGFVIFPTVMYNRNIIERQKVKPTIETVIESPKAEITYPKTKPTNEQLIEESRLANETAKDKFNKLEPAMK